MVVTQNKQSYNALHYANKYAKDTKIVEMIELSMKTESENHKNEAKMLHGNQSNKTKSKKIEHKYPLSMKQCENIY